MAGYGAETGWVKIVNLTPEICWQVYVATTLYSHSEQLIMLVVNEVYKQILGYILLGQRKLFCYIKTKRLALKPICYKHFVTL